MNVSVREAAVREVDVQRVEPGRVELALVVRQAVEDPARGVVGDAREAADGRAREGRACRDDRLAEELQTWRLRAVARTRSGNGDRGEHDCGRERGQPAWD